MKKRKWKQITALALSAAMAVGMVGTGAQGSEEEKLFDIAAYESEHLGNPVTISLYPANANLTSGTVSGYLGEYFADEQGLAIEVWAYSEEKTNAILASGDMPDVMYVTAENLSTMIDAGMVLQLDDYLEELPHVQSAIADNDLEPALEYVRKYRSNDTGYLYAMPTSVGGIDVYDNADRNVVKLNWSIYEEIGAPEINSYEELIEVAAQMMEAHPTDAETGKKIYGTLLNSGSDGTYWGNIIVWLRWHGYKEDELPYLLEADMLNGVYSSILEDNSMYYQGLKFYFECMQAGILDPDSINTDRSTAGSTTRMFGGGTQPGWHDEYFEYYIPGTKYYIQADTNPFGSTDCYLVINANTKNLDACLKFIDMMADPDAQLLGNAGPEGDMYVISDDGVLTLTEKAKEYYASNSGEGYFYENGEQAYLWNTAWILASDAIMTYKGPDGEDLCSVHTGWPEEKAITSNSSAYNSWKETTGYESWQALVEANDAVAYTSDLDYISTFTSTPDDSMQLIISAINDTVVDASWRMVYAESEEEFESIWEQMVNDCIDLGAEDIMEWRIADIENARAERDSVMGSSD